MAGNQGNNRVVWKQWQIDFLKANYKSMTAEQLSDAIGVTRTKVRQKKYELGLYMYELEYWTPRQVRFLKNNYRKYGDSELADMFNIKWLKKKGWSKKHIEKKRRYLKLVRTTKEKIQIHQRNKLRGCFKLCPVKAWAKRGICKEGTLRVWRHQNGRPFMVIKKGKGFVYYSRLLYKEHFGKIPKGLLVGFIDNNPLNVTPSNLVLRTRAEHAANNSLNRCPVELRPVRYMQRSLEKRIHTINKRLKQSA
jgi:hypothetical protein